MLLENRLTRVGALAFALFLSPAPAAQGMGSRPDAAAGAAHTDTLDDFAVENYIKIQGRAEVRVEPTGIRVVFAVTTQSATPSACREANAQKQAEFTAALARTGIEESAVSSDFISMLPVFEWVIEDQEGQKVAVERLSGYLMQTNVHVHAATEADAERAVAEAFRVEIPDIIAFDYWCENLDQFKVQAQEKALAEAKRKSDLFLSVFDEKPRVINVNESTKTSYPQALYRSFENAYAQQYQANYRYNGQAIPQIAAMRPKNYYYSGFFEQVDVQNKKLPLRPQISVVSTVQLYFRSPAEAKLPPDKTDDKDEK